MVITKNIIHPRLLPETPDHHALGTDVSATACVPFEAATIIDVKIDVHNS